MKQYSLLVKLVGGSLLALLFMALLFLVVEVYFRFNGNYPRSHFQYDPQTIWRLKKNHRGQKAWGEDHFPLKFNKQGFRGPNYRLKKSPDLKRVMFLGDSYTAGLDVRYKDLFSSKVAQQLNAAQEKYEVLNASSPAWGTDQEYIFWMTEGVKYQPDYLILAVAPNDIREMYMKKLVKLDDNGNIVINPVEYPTNARLGWYWANRSSFFQFLQKEVWDTHYGHFWDIFKHYPVNFGKGDSTNWDLPLFLNDPFPEVAESRRLFKALLTGINESCNAIDCKLLLTIIPTKMEFDGTLDDPAYDAGIIADLVGEVAAEAQIPYLNLYQHLKEQPDPMALFISWEFHLNETGNEYIANQIFPFFKSKE